MRMFVVKDKPTWLRIGLRFTGDDECISNTTTHSVAIFFFFPFVFLYRNFAWNTIDLIFNHSIDTTIYSFNISQFYTHALAHNILFSYADERIQRIFLCNTTEKNTWKISRENTHSNAIVKHPTIQTIFVVQISVAKNTLRFRLFNIFFFNSSPTNVCNTFDCARKIIMCSIKTGITHWLTFSVIWRTVAARVCNEMACEVGCFESILVACSTGRGVRSLPTTVSIETARTIFQAVVASRGIVEMLTSQ